MQIQNNLLSTHFRRMIVEAPAIAALCASLFFCSSAFAFLFVPRISAVSSTLLKADVYRDQISSSNSQEKINSEIENKNRQLEQKLLNLSTSGINHTVSEALEMLIVYADEANIQFVKMLPQPEVEQSAEFSLYPVHLETTTQYDNLGKFLARLENLPQLFRIRRVAMEVNPAGKLDIRLLVAAFISHGEVQ